MSKIDVDKVWTDRYRYRKYDGETNPRKHIQLCTMAWKEIPQQEWAHGFIHTLETIPRKWYLETKL